MDGLCIGQMIKHMHKRRVVEVSRRLIEGSWATAEQVMTQTPGCQVLNTAYIARLNGTFRARLAPLGRRTHHLVYHKELHSGMFLVGGLYHFCTLHANLKGGGGEQQTQAMAVGITEHWWTVPERRIAPPRWQPARRRGRRSQVMQHLVERWCPS